MAGYAGSCHAVAPQMLPLVCPRRISDAPQPAVHRQLHFSPHPTYTSATSKNTETSNHSSHFTHILLLAYLQCRRLGKRYKWPGPGSPERGPVARKGARWSGKRPGDSEGGPVLRKGARWPRRGPGGPERGPVVRKGVRWPGKGPGGPEGGPVVRKGARWSSRDQRTDYVEYVYVSLGKATVKFNLEQATKTQRGS